MQECAGAVLDLSHSLPTVRLYSRHIFMPCRSIGPVSLTMFGQPKTCQSAQISHAWPTNVRKCFCQSPGRPGGSNVCSHLSPQPQNVDTAMKKWATVVASQLCKRSGNLIAGARFYSTYVYCIHVAHATSVLQVLQLWPQSNRMWCFRSIPPHTLHLRVCANTNANLPSLSESRHTLHAHTLHVRCRFSLAYIA